MLKLLREHFSFEKNNEILVGPQIVDITEDEYQMNLQKFEAIDPEKIDKTVVDAIAEKEELEKQVQEKNLEIKKRLKKNDK